MKILVDEGHGQLNWGKTGYPSRRIDTTLIAMANILQSLGYECSSTQNALTTKNLEGNSALVIPPSTGSFNSRLHKWHYSEQSQFSHEEIISILNYLSNGGRLLAFAYRFGDLFTKTNIHELFTALGWLLNNDAVIAPQFIEQGVHPLYAIFKTSSESILEPWASKGVSTVLWRPLATFDILPTGIGMPVVIAPQECVRFDFHHSISHEPKPICVSGIYGDGRYILVGGPHAFEQGKLGFIDQADNQTFLKNLLNWLFSNELLSASAKVITSSTENRHDEKNAIIKSLWEDVCNASDNHRKGESFVNFIQNLLLDSGILLPRKRSVWSLDKESEIDLVYECFSSKPLWLNSRGIIPVECKNWKDPVGSPEITRFAEKVDRTGSKIGLFAMRSLTEAAWSAISKARLRHNVVVGVLNDEDFTTYIQGKASSSSILEASVVRSMLL